MSAARPAPATIHPTQLLDDDGAASSGATALGAASGRASIVAGEGLVGVGVAIGSGAMPGSIVAVGRGVGAFVGRGVARGVGVARAVGVAAGVGVDCGVRIGVGVGVGVGVGCAVGREDGKLKSSNPGMVCWAGAVCASAGAAAAPASRRAIALERARREMVMYPVLTRNRLPAP